MWTYDDIINRRINIQSITPIWQWKTGEKEGKREVQQFEHLKNDRNFFSKDFFQCFLMEKLKIAFTRLKLGSKQTGSKNEGNKKGKFNNSRLINLQPTLHHREPSQLIYFKSGTHFKSAFSSQFFDDYYLIWAVPLKPKDMFSTQNLELKIIFRPY